MVALTELARQLSTGERTDTWTYGVEVDDLAFLHKTPLRAIGLVANYTDDGDLDDDTIDAATQLIIDGVDVTVELPHRSELPVQTLVTEAANLQIGLSFLPPGEGAGDDDWASYHTNLEAGVEAYFRQRNLGTSLFPISGYIEYLIGEHVGAEAPAIEDVDEYTRERFAKNVPQTRADAMKARLRDRVMEVVGGEAGWRRMVNTVLHTATERLGEMEQEVRARYRPTELPAPVVTLLKERGAF